MLSRQGYQVIPCSRPTEAIKRATQKSGAIHLLITDVVMPEMNGRSLAKKFPSFFPGSGFCTLRAIQGTYWVFTGSWKAGSISSANRTRPGPWSERSAKSWTKPSLVDALGYSGGAMQPRASCFSPSMSTFSNRPWASLGM